MRKLIICLALGCALSASAFANTVHLRRFEHVRPYQVQGVQWGETSYTYMDVMDTVLDSRHPGDNFGASKILALNPGQSNVLLVKFDQLNRAIGRGSKITDVQLVLHPVEGKFAKDVDIAICRVASDWRDGGAEGQPMYWTATYDSAFSSGKGNAVPWARPGARGDADRLTKASLMTNTSVGYAAATNTWTITGPGLTKDVQYWFGREYRNFGWAIEMQQPKSARGAVQVYSSETMEKELHPELVVTYEPLPTEGVQKGVDLNVAFIARTPRYLRYNDNGRTTYERKRYRNDNAGIMKYPDNANTKKWPDKGEILTYTAHIKNSGFETYSGPVDWEWRYNGKLLKSGTATVNLAPEKEVTESIKLPWKGDMTDIRDEKLSFEVDPKDKIKELTKNNNQELRYVKARVWKYWVERTAYEDAKQYMNAYGSYSFEDYLKWHEHIWNETYLDKSRFDGLAPDGCKQRIALDDFEIVADGLLGGGIHRFDDKPDFHFDGEWGTEWPKGKDRDDPAAIKNIDNFLHGQRVYLEGSLLHECSHQVLGAFDIYWSNIEPADLTHPGKQHIKDGSEYYVTRGDMYPYSCLMGGDDTRPNDQYTEGTGLFSAHSVMGFNSDLPYRNGFYGEWQYDLPRSISVRLLAADGEPVRNAKVKIWQFSGTKLDDKNLVAEGLTADENGVLKLPDQDSGEAADYTVATGHTMLKKNPFGRIDVVGSNTLLMLKVEGYGQKDYRFVRTVDLNRGYWMGYKDKYTYDVKTQITDAEVDWSTNIAKAKPVQSVLNPAEAGKLTDDDTKTTWNGGAAPAGTYLQIDLGETAGPVGAIRFYQNGSYGSFFQRFKIELSDDPGFRTGVTELNRQFPYSFGKTMSDDRDIDPASPEVHYVTYGVRPTEGRYLRITSLEDGGGCSMSEIRVFGAKK